MGGENPGQLSGQLMTMPILIVNMGGEMVYILEQRLEAQKIPDSKGQKVLQDVVRTMYYPRFIEELFKPQEMYSTQSTRQIFDRLAHSSIMRLNESSMDKLFDLMAMGFKYQLISCTTTEEILKVTMNHLEALKGIVGDSAPELLELLEECCRMMRTTYDRMPPSELNALRQTLCAFFQDRRVKVSLFLQDQTQNPDGSIVVPNRGTLPRGRQKPGTLRYSQQGQDAGTFELPLVSSSNWKPSAGTVSSLGANLYAKDRGAAAKENAPPASDHANPSMAHSIPAAMSSAPVGAPGQCTAAAVGELNMLASLIGTQPASTQDTFKLENLFGAGVFDKKDPGKARAADVIEIDGTAPSVHREAVDSVRRQMDSLDLGAPQGGHGNQVDDQGQDLLDLMDQA